MQRKWLVLGALLGSAAGCAALAEWWHFRREPEEHLSRESLLATACDPGQSPDARGKAVFRLFADYLPHDADAATAHEVFGGCDWIAEAQVIELDMQTGDGHPLWVKVGGTLFCLDLFPPAEGRTDWIIYVRFSDPCSPDDVRRFFSPKAASNPRLRLAESALWNRRTGKQQVFDAVGRHPPKDGP
jgi:hypothetical protein